MPKSQYLPIGIWHLCFLSHIRQWRRRVVDCRATLDYLLTEVTYQSMLWASSWCYNRVGMFNSTSQVLIAMININHTDSPRWQIHLEEALTNIDCRSNHRPSGTRPIVFNSVLTRKILDVILPCMMVMSINYPIMLSTHLTSQDCLQLDLPL